MFGDERKTPPRETGRRFGVSTYSLAGLNRLTTNSKTASLIHMAETPMRNAAA